MSSTALDSPLASGPRRIGWPVLLALVALDAAILLTTETSPLLLAALASAAVAAWLIARPHRALAVAAVGLPLLDPLLESIGDTRPGLLAGLALLSIPLILQAWRAVWSFPEQKRARESATRSPFGVLITSPVFHAVLGVWLVLVLGQTWTPSPIYAELKVKGYLLTNLLLFVAATVILSRQGNEPVDAWRERGLSFCAAVLLLECLIALAGVANYFLHWYPWRGRLLVLGINAIWVARHMDVGILLLLPLLRLGRLGRVQAFVTFCVLGWVHWQTGSRGPLVAILVAALVWVMLDNSAGRARRVLLALGVAGLLVATGATLVWLSLGAHGQDLPFGGRGVSNFVRARLLTVARDALHDAGIWGIGTGGFNQIAKVGDIRFYPHNIFVELAVENGILGLAAFCALLLGLARATRSGARVRAPITPELIRIASTLAAYSLVSAQFSGDITSNEWLWLWAGALVAWSRGDTS